jgi:hypothetical protein
VGRPGAIIVADNARGLSLARAVLEHAEDMVGGVLAWMDSPRPMGQGRAGYEFMVLAQPPIDEPINSPIQETSSLPADALWTISEPTVFVSPLGTAFIACNPFVASTTRCRGLSPRESV